MIPALQFKFCPRCGKKTLNFSPEKRACCGSCGLVFFINIAAAAGVLLCRKDHLLVTVRKFDPGKGRIDLPGGFGEAGESLEEIAMREVKEELGVDIVDLTFAGSMPNEYTFCGVTYFTADVFFFAREKIKQINLPVDSTANFIMDQEEIAGIKWIPLTVNEIDLYEFAFESNRYIIQKLMQNGELARYASES